MPIQTIRGDLVKMAERGDFDAIVHGCNCFHTMGAGLAKSIKHRFPDAYQADLDYSFSSDKEMLGKYSSATIEQATGQLMVINAYTQYGYRRDKELGLGPIDYNAIRYVFARLDEDLPPGMKIGIPRIGAGLAGGDWHVIRSIIESEAPNLDLTVVEL